MKIAIPANYYIKNENYQFVHGSQEKHLMTRFRLSVILVPSMNSTPIDRNRTQKISTNSHVKHEKVHVHGDCRKLQVHST